jgi:hypothetical protein
MGLDSVEIVMRIEEEFSIDLPDAELGSVRTVGDLYQIVLSKLDTISSADCLTSKAFYRTRRALVDSLGLSRRSIRPSSALELLLPAESRRLKWAEIASNIGLTFPRLQPSRSQKDLFLTLSLALPTVAIIAVWGAAHFYLGSAVGILLFWISAFVIWVLLIGLTNWSLIAATRSLMAELPVPTVGDLARMLLTMNFTAFAPASDGSKPLSREAVWTQIVHILSDQMQIDAEEIVPEARITEDLRID